MDDCPMDDGADPTKLVHSCVSVTEVSADNNVG